MLAALACIGRWSGYQTAIVERDQHWQQRLIEHGLGKWTVDETTGEKSFKLNGEE